jgi:hypothetical protein
MHQELARIPAEEARPDIAVAPEIAALLETIQKPRLFAQLFATP